MSHDEAAIEAEIEAKGLNAPRLSPEMIDAQIRGAEFHVFVGTELTVCRLELSNGFSVTGYSAAASPENFDAELGQKIAQGNARSHIWPLEGYLLKEVLHVIATNPDPEIVEAFKKYKAVRFAR